MKLIINARCLTCDWQLEVEVPEPQIGETIAPTHGLSCADPRVAAQITTIERGWVLGVQPLITRKAKPAPVLDRLTEAGPPRMLRRHPNN